MSLRSLERLQLENSLRYALQQNELFLHYQPQIDLKTKHMIGVEALLRWEHPVHGSVSPSRFIPLAAEECGLITPLGEWVLATACRQTKAWQDKYERELDIAVNLSSQQFFSSDVASVVLKTIYEAGLTPNSMHLELTETILMNDVKETIITLNKLRDAGVSLAMDDFGKGYSSLSYLKQLPLDTLKIDKSFVIDLEHNRDDAAICAAIISMAHNLDMKVIAEGVETREQLQYLEEHGCDQVQGYLISKPLSAEDLEERFLKNILEKIPEQ
jgi:EAL domain-containing protein (putative c-di-GMP-specific phosphodiesterase class I)